MKQVKNWYKYSQIISFFKKLKSLKPLIVMEAQKIYDYWDQDQDGVDEEYGCGGICDEISKSIEHIININIDGVEIFTGGQDGDDHAWAIARLNGETFGIDIPPIYYELGSGYCWVKKPNVIFKEDMIEIFPIKHFEENGENYA